MSSGGTSSRLHSHDDHNLHCVLFGRRDFILIEAQFKQNFAYQADVSFEWDHLDRQVQEIKSKLIDIFRRWIGWMIRDQI